jgi:hypothetical protein
VPDASTVAIVSVVVSGTTAIVVPLVTGGLESRREERRFERERVTKDFDELRDFLDEMTQKLYAHTGEKIRLEGAYTHPSAPPESDLRAEATSRTAELYQPAPRLVIRIGREHPVTQAFGVYLRLIDETFFRMWAKREPFEELNYDQVERGPYWTHTSSTRKPPSNSSARDWVPCPRSANTAPRSRRGRADEPADEKFL